MGRIVRSLPAFKGSRQAPSLARERLGESRLTRGRPGASDPTFPQDRCFATRMRLLPRVGDGHRRAATFCLTAPAERGTDIGRYCQRRAGSRGSEPRLVQISSVNPTESKKRPGDHPRALVTTDVRLVGNVYFFFTPGRTSTMPRSMYWPPPVWWQCTAITFLPGLRAALPCSLSGTRL